MYGGYGMGFGGGFMWVFLILLIIAIAWAVKITLGSNRPGPGKTAREILDERYARGEIEEAEYRRRREEIER